MRQLSCLAFLVLASVALAQGRPDNIDKPLWDSQRALSHLQGITSGAWINGDWGLRVILSSGKGESAVSAPMEIIGGWTEGLGRWQRIHLPNGTQTFTQSLPTASVGKLNATTLVPMTEAQLHSPIVDRIGLSWDVYTMSFLNWANRDYQSVERAHGRWCDKVELKGSDGIYAKALVWIDTEFGAPLEAELYDSHDHLIKTIRAVSMQKVGSDWVLRRWEVLDAVSHAKVTIDITAVALGGRWPEVVYNPSALAPGWPELAPEAWKALE